MPITIAPGQILLTDGAMGTYYAEKTGDFTGLPEGANLSNPALVRDIHREYIAAGASLIRTNTFSANRFLLECMPAVRNMVLKNAYTLAMEAAEGADVIVAADLGPIPETVPGRILTEEEIANEYAQIVQAFLDFGARHFVFETLSDPGAVLPAVALIKEKQPSAWVLTQFAVMPDGHTRKGIHFRELAEALRGELNVDAYGFNCGSGPAHLAGFIRQLDIGDGKPFSTLPNAGYPEIVNERTIYTQKPEYFAEVLAEIASYGVTILGGCCGTTPRHIEAAARRLKREAPAKRTVSPIKKEKTAAPAPADNAFRDKLTGGQYPAAVELDPPYGADIAKLVAASRVLRYGGADIITISDSPLARVRMDAALTSVLLMQESGLPTMPHFCCRDKNIIALKSQLLAAHAAGIRNILAVTGDGIAGDSRAEVKSVFNTHSKGLISMIREMNQDVFSHAPFFVGGAFNINAANIDAEWNRVLDKHNAGASFFLTQFIFSEEAVSFLKRMKKPEGMYILGGILPLVSYRNAVFMSQEIPGIHIPQEMIERFDPGMDRVEAQEAGTQLAVEMAETIRPYVDGLYIMAPFNRADMAVDIISRIREGA